MQISRITAIIIFSAVAATASFFMYEAPMTDADEFTASVERQLALWAERARFVLPLPVLVDMSVPFTAQAPLGDWSQPWQDACEETSVLMAMAWVRGASLTPVIAADEIRALVDFEEMALGYHRDTTLVDTARLFTDFYQYQNIAIVRDTVTIDRIRKELARGNLVIAPLAGEILAHENTYFTSPPHYHMVVIRGYDDATRQFITNEPGTRFGDGFRYSYETLFEAIHDWTGDPETILEGGKAMLIVRPTLSDTI